MMRSTRISTAWILLLVLVVRDQHSHPCFSKGLRIFINYLIAVSWDMSVFKEWVQEVKNFTVRNSYYLLIFKFKY